MKNSILALINKLKLSRARTILILAFCAVLPLGQFERVTSPWGFSFYLHDLLCLAWLIWELPSCTGVWKRENFLNSLLKKISQHKLVFFLLAWIGVGMVFHTLWQPSLSPWLLLGRVVIYGLFSWRVGRRFHKNKTALLCLLAITGVLYFWLAFLQYFFLPDTRFLWLFGWDEHYYRMIGTLFDPAFTGILGVLLLLVLYSLKKFLPVAAFFIAEFAVIVGIVVTYSRASYLALGVVLLLFFVRNFKTGFLTKQRMLGVGIFVLCLAGVWLLAPRPGGDGVQLLRTTSAIARVKTVQAAFQNFSGSQVIWGSGLFSSSTVPQQGTWSANLPLHSHTPDNIFVLLITQTGLVGFGLCLAVFLSYCKKLRLTAPLAWVAILAVLVHSQFNSTLLQATILVYLLLFLQTQGEKN